MKLRNQPANTSGRVSPVGSGSTVNLGALPAHSLATWRRPWYRALGRSSSCSRGSMLAVQVRMLMAAPQPLAE